MIIKTTKRVMLALAMGSALLLNGCAGDDQEMEEVVAGEQEELSSDDVIEASEEAAEQAADQMEEDYQQEQSQVEDAIEESAEYYSESDDIEDTGAIDSEDAMMDAEPTYADTDATSYSDDTVEIEDNEDDQVDLSDNSEKAEMADVTPVEEPAYQEPEAPVAMEESPVMSSGDAMYLVQPGDTLSIIAGKLYGDSSKWRDLASMNNLSGSQTIYPGDQISYDSANPNVEQYVRKMENSTESVTVEKGDSLSSLSQKIFGTGGGWKYLYQFNADKISNPNQIFVGQVIKFVKSSGSSMTH